MSEMSERKVAKTMSDVYYLLRVPSGVSIQAFKKTYLEVRKISIQNIRILIIKTDIYVTANPGQLHHVNVCTL